MINLKKNLKCTIITDGLEKIVTDHIYKDYVKSDLKFPAGICPPCKTHLYIVKKKGKDAVPASALASS